MAGDVDRGRGELAPSHWGFDAGPFTDADGRTQFGPNVGAALYGKASWDAKADPPRGPHYVHGFEAGLGDGALQMTIGESGLALGLQGNVGGGAA